MKKQRKALMRFIGAVAIWGTLAFIVFTTAIIGIIRADMKETGYSTPEKPYSVGNVQTANIQTEQTIEELVYYYCQEYGVDYNLACAVITVECVASRRK